MLQHGRARRGKPALARRRGVGLRTPNVKLFQLTPTVRLEPTQLLLPGNRCFGLWWSGRSDERAHVWRNVSSVNAVSFLGVSERRHNWAAPPRDTFINQDDLDQHATDMRTHTHVNTHVNTHIYSTRVTR